jgi:plastocyanin
MRFARLNRLAAFAAVLGAVECGGGGGGGTQPPGPPTDLVKSGGDAQSWYFNNPLPTLLSVTAKDASGRAVPGVVVTWAVTSGAGAVNPRQDTTDASGVATTADSVGSSTIQTVSATFTGLPGPVSFTEHADVAPTSAGVNVNDNFFSPGGAAIKTGGTVTWTWVGAANHNVTFTGGPTPRPADGPTQMMGTYTPAAITTIGTYTYHCTIHAGMDGTLTVVH